MLTRRTSSKFSGLVSSAAPGKILAALDTRISTGPNAASASLANRVTEPRSARSRWQATASPPSARMDAATSSHISTRRAPSTTGWPARANARAASAPMPEEAPVTAVGRRSG